MRDFEFSAACSQVQGSVAPRIAGIRIRPARQQQRAGPVQGPMRSGGMQRSLPLGIGKIGIRPQLQQSAQAGFTPLLQRPSEQRAALGILPVHIRPGLDQKLHSRRILAGHGRIQRALSLGIGRLRISPGIQQQTQALNMPSGRRSPQGLPQEASPRPHLLGEPLQKRPQTVCMPLKSRPLRRTRIGDGSGSQQGTHAVLVPIEGCELQRRDSGATPRIRIRPGGQQRRQLGLITALRCQMQGCPAVTERQGRLFRQQRLRQLSGRHTHFDLAENVSAVLITRPLIQIKIPQLH